MNDIINIDKWKVPKKLFDDYVKWTIHADNYLLNKVENPSSGTPAAEYERSMRWNLCVKKVMEIHREICLLLDVEYTTDVDDEFYKAFHREVRKLTKLKGGCD